MACERPVVSSRIGSTPTLIEDGATGVLVPPGHVRSIAEAVASLLVHPQRRAAMGTLARERVTGRFGLDTMVDGTIGVYESLAGRPAAAAATGRTP
jgi:glycosyltransferase involved in cell wall biosynthesis